MNRAHKVFICTIEYDAQAWQPDPEAPGSGEMVRAGAPARRQITLTIAAPHELFVRAWLNENPHRYPGVVLQVVEEHKLDAVIELHTY